MFLSWSKCMDGNLTYKKPNSVCPLMDNTYRLKREEKKKRKIIKKIENQNVHLRTWASQHREWYYMWML